MDPLGVEPMEEPGKGSDTLLQDDDHKFYSFETQVISATMTSLPPETPEKSPSPDHFSDIFGDNFISSKPNDSLLFVLDDASKDYSLPSWGRGDNSTFDQLEEAARNEGISVSSSLFDDLLDFSSPRTSEIDTILKDNMAKIKPIPQVDLLVGVDCDLDTSSEVKPEVKVKNPDILDFEEIPDDQSELQNMDVTDGLTCDSLNDGWSLVKEVTPVSPGGELSPDIIVTSSDLDPDTANGKETKTDLEEEKTDENVKEMNAEKAENIKDGASNQDIDFSVLELPESSNLNFDHFKHKRNISMKGSIANRKKPKRSTIQQNCDDTFFIDSTEPKPQKLEAEDDKETESSPSHNKEDKPQEVESEVPEESSPSRKPVGGIKIPGLLEGLSKSKAFNKVGKMSPEAEPDIVPQATSPTAESEKDKSPSSPQSTSTSTITNSPQFILPKPVVLPRVLPKPTNKTLKETLNQTTSGGSVLRASSFKITSPKPVLEERPSFLKGGSSALSRSASVKVTVASTNNDLEQSSPKERTTTSFGFSKFSPATKPEIKNPLGPTAFKPLIKTPPPVPSKPPLVAAKPSRNSLRLSASFAGVRSPLLSETRTESSSIPAKKSDPDIIILNGKNQTELTSSEHNPKSDALLITDNKSTSYSFSSARKPYSFDHKTVETHSSETPDKISVTIESTKSISGELESPKQASLTRIPSLKTTPQSGYVASTRFKPTEMSTKKAENFDDDVFNTSSGTADKSGALSSIPDSSSPCEKLDNSNVEEIVQHRKSSISGIMSVKSPLIGDKPPTGAMPRKGSITGSAYNPIGFRSTLGSSDSEQRSRGSSFSSTVDAVASVDPVPFVSTSSPNLKDDSFGFPDGQRSRDGSLNSTAANRVGHTPDKPLASTPGRTEPKPVSVADAKYTPTFQRKIVDEKKNEAATETRVGVREPVRTLRETTSPSVTNGPAQDRKSSPWNVQLKKVEKKEPIKVETTIKTDETQPINWRQQLSMRSRNTPPPKDAEKPKQDTTPDWAKASIKRRQRLIDSGVIRSDS